MLDSLIKIGQMLGSERSVWERATTVPIDAETERKKREKNISLYVQEIVFNIDTQDIELGKLYAYDSTKAEYFRNIRSRPRRADPTYVTISMSKLPMLQKSLFGNEERPEKGFFTHAIDKKYSHLKESLFYKSLIAIYSLKTTFDSKFNKEQKPPFLNISQGSEIIMLTTSIKWKEMKLDEATFLFNLEGYIEFAKLEILTNDDSDNEEITKTNILCYASGNLMSDVVSAKDFRDAPEIYGMFRTTTKNYATNFEEKNFKKNYQVSKSLMTNIEDGAEFISQKLKTRIAEIPHFIVPQFKSSDVLTDDIFESIREDTDWIFAHKDIYQNVIRPMKNSFPLFWLTFLSFDTDGGKTFKATNTIKDVNSIHFLTIMKAFMHVNKIFHEQGGINWKVTHFNFYTLYSVIPVRAIKKGDLKRPLGKNLALALFKIILENRKIDSSLIFNAFKEAILCHWFGRHKSYFNIYQFEKFDKACSETVFKYLAFIQFLKKLNLIKDMENTQIHDEDTPSVVAASSNEESKKKITAQEIQAKIDAFFLRMNYSNPQQAMFYLGRILDAVARKQAEKSHESKPVLNKINFNGLDVNAIKRLKGDLFEKTLQYREIHDNCKPLFGRFDNLFEYNHADSKSWSMKPEESLFYLLSGYSFNVFA